MKHPPRPDTGAATLPIILLLVSAIAGYAQSSDAWSLARVAARALEADPSASVPPALLPALRLCSTSWSWIGQGLSLA
ncbi:hypothetical protein MASR2M48_34550 [Spirochaetota bacterium]